MFFLFFVNPSDMLRFKLTWLKFSSDLTGMYKLAEISQKTVLTKSNCKKFVYIASCLYLWQDQDLSDKTRLALFILIYTFRYCVFWPAWRTLLSKSEFLETKLICNWYLAWLYLVNKSQYYYLVFKNKEVKTISHV